VEESTWIKIRHTYPSLVHLVPVYFSFSSFFWD
jgi:hypothetical protein